MGISRFFFGISFFGGSYFFGFGFLVANDIPFVVFDAVSIAGFLLSIVPDDKYSPMRSPISWKTWKYVQVKLESVIANSQSAKQDIS